jgi:hypothetical protein
VRIPGALGRRIGQHWLALPVNPDEPELRIHFGLLDLLVDTQAVGFGTGQQSQLMEIAIMRVCSPDKSRAEPDFSIGRPAIRGGI